MNLLPHILGGGGDDDYGLTSSTSILIQGATHLNRAVNGDKVAIEVFDKSQWNRPSNLLVVESGEDKEDEATDQMDGLAEGRKGGLVRFLVRLLIGLSQNGT